MSKLSIGLPEIVHLVQSSINAVPYVRSISTEEDKLHVVVKSPRPLEKAITVDH